MTSEEDKIVEVLNSLDPRQDRCFCMESGEDETTNHNQFSGHVFTNGTKRLIYPCKNHLENYRRGLRKGNIDAEVFP